MLQSIASPCVTLVSVVLGSGLNSYLLSALFKQERHRKPTEHELSHIKHRKPFQVRLLGCSSSKRERNLRKTAEDKMYR